MSSKASASHEEQARLAESSGFRDTSVDCAICLCPLSSEPCLTLTCGHVWHESCIRSQLLHSNPNPARRLLFSGCRCAKCAAFCDHPALADVARPHLDLSAKVNDLILDQLRVDGVQLHGEDALQYGRRTYAFYLCMLCREPYFGGTIECADEDARDLPTDDRLCQKCSPRTTKACGHPIHRASYVWKCRYCCQRASFVCYGSTHFCADCHERNSNRRTGEILKGIICPGSGRCKTPMPEGHESHKNGAEPDCELLLYCVTCETDVGQAISRTERTSPNMLYNPSGEHGLLGWQALSRSATWRVEQSEHPLRNCPTNFVSTCSWCIMAQVVDLTKFIRNPSNAYVKVSARYMARWDCPSVFKLEGALFDRDYNRIKDFTTDSLPAPPDYWDEAANVFEPTPGAHFALIVVHGTDNRFWAGDYGSKVADCSIRVLFDDSVDDESLIIIPEAYVNVEEPAVAAWQPFLRSYRNAQQARGRSVRLRVPPEIPGRNRRERRRRDGFR